MLNLKTKNNKKKEGLEETFRQFSKAEMIISINC